MEHTGEKVEEDEQLDTALVARERLMYLQGGEKCKPRKPKSPKLTPIIFLKDRPKEKPGTTSLFDFGQILPAYIDTQNELEIKNEKFTGNYTISGNAITI